VHVEILDVGVDGASNLALESARSESTAYVPGARRTVWVTPMRGGAETGFHFAAWLNGEPAGRVDGSGPTGEPIAMVLHGADSVPSLDALRMTIEPDDRLALDQSRYAWLQTSKPPLVWVVVAGANGAEPSLAERILTNLLAPAGIDTASLPYRPRVLVPESISLDDPPPALIVPGGGPLDARAIDVISAWVQRGACLLLMPNDAGDSPPMPDTWRRRIFSEAPQVDFGATHRMRWTMIPARDQEDELRELERCEVRRRWSAPKADRAHGWARFDDGRPAIVSAEWDRGEIWSIATSADPACSDLGIRAAGLLTFAHVLMGRGTHGEIDCADFQVGDLTRRPFASLPETGEVSVRRVDPPMDDVSARQMTPEGPDSPWPTDSPGLYLVEATGSTEAPRAAYSVNWPAEESDLARIGLSDIADRLGCSPDQVRLFSRNDGTSRSENVLRLAGRIDPYLSVATLLFLASGVELWLASRRPAGR
jgi:hypothetical protein